MSASRASSDSVLGTTTSTVARRSPFVPSRRRTPLPRTRNVRPFAVPAGILTVTVEPPGTGTLTCAPSAASANVIGTVTVTLSPLRPNAAWGRTCTTTYRSPEAPPFSPGAPLPASRMRWPSLTPEGMRVLTVRVLVPRPEPWHVVQGSSTTSPRPRHSGQGSVKAKPPALRAKWPEPSHVGQIRGTVPDLAPVPWHTGHGASPVRRSGIVTPSSASSKDSETSDSTSAPRRPCRGRPVVPPPPEPPRLNRPPKMSPRSLLPARLKRSPRSGPPLPPPRPVPGNRNPPPPPNSERASSNSLRLSSSPTTEYASETALKRSSAFLSSGFLSGCRSRASLR